MSRATGESECGVIEVMPAVRGDDVGRLRRLAELLNDVPITDQDYDGERRLLVREIAAYLLPRLEHPDAPLVVAVTGATGAGKSHIVNALTGTTHSPESPFRPTTTAPVVISSDRRQDDDWPGSRRMLRSLATGATFCSNSSAVTERIDIIDLPADMADPVAARLLAVADLAIVVASPVRYADSATWELVAQQRRIGQPVWVVVNRATGQDDEVGADLKRRLVGAGLEVPVFLLPEGDDAPAAVVRARLIDAAGPGRHEVLDPALDARTETTLQRVAALTAPLDELRARGERLKRLADAEYQTAATALSELILENGLGAGAAAATWSDVAERLAGVVTRRVGVAAERTASAWHTLDDGNVLLSGSGHELWRHPPDTAHTARSRLLQWEQAVAVIVNRRSRRQLKPHRLGPVVSVVKAEALGGSPKVSWLMKRRLRDGIEPAAAEARGELAALAASIVSDDESRFLDHMGVRPAADLVAELRELALRPSEPAASASLPTQSAVEAPEEPKAAIDA